jgi:flavin reductase (DIM6/NTAB) family NADH-FMN oxidoreductase RutF
MNEVMEMVARRGLVTGAGVLDTAASVFDCRRAVRRRTFTAHHIHVGLVAAVVHREGRPLVNHDCCYCALVPQGMTPGCSDIEAPLPALGWGS